MGQKQCEKCGELADEAKAFCPACGEPFVAEQVREDQSKFDKMDSTVQLGQTMYNQMLSDMGLNIKAQAEKSHRKIVVQPIAPVAEAASAKGPEASPKIPTSPATSRKWLWAAIAGLLLMIVAAIATLAVAYYLFRR